MAWYRCRHKGDGGVTPVGDAIDGDVLSGKTYMNALGASTGTMPNRGAVSATLNTSTTSYTVPQGYHNGSGKVSITTQTKSATPSTSAQTISPDSGKVLSSVSVGAISTQTKSASPSTSAQTISPDSGKYLSSVSISAISPQRSTGTAASASGRDSSGPYVYFPYGWWPNYSSSRNYTRLTEPQAIAVARTQTKTTDATRLTHTVSPDINYLLSSVTVNKFPDATGTFTPTGNSSAVDMGAANNYRYVNTDPVFNIGKKQGVGLFLQNLERYAFWFTTNNVCGGDVSISGTTCTFNNCSFCIFVIVNRADYRFLNLLVKYQNHWRWVDDDAGSTNKCGVDYVNCQDTYISIRRGTGIDLFLNAWRYNF